MKICRNVIKMKVSVFLVKFLWILTVCRGDTEVSCVFMERCILPCSFQVAPQVVIHWTHSKTDPVHSYYDNQDELGHQHQIYRNRTSLFKDQISRGNSSLQLTAPVHKVNIQQVEDRIICRSEGIYPEPELTWSTTPPSNINPHNTTPVKPNDEQLFNISSSLILSDSDADLVHICNVSIQTNWKIAAWRKLTPISGSRTETIISCAASNFSFSHLVWRFNHNQMILNHSRTDGRSTVSEEWRQQVKDVSESGDITLKDLSSEQEGTYTCELSDAEETLISDTSVKISGVSGKSVDGGIIGGVIGAGLVLTAAAVGLLLTIKRKKVNKKTTQEDQVNTETM